MNIQEKYHNNIGFYKNVFPDGLCNHLIKEFDKLQKDGLTINRKKSENCNKTDKEDEHFFLNYYNNPGLLKDFNDHNCFQLIKSGIQNCFDLYCEEYDVLRNFNINCTEFKIQKSKPGSGYHIWHCEQTDGNTSARVLTYILYLNDIKDAGETEFLYQRIRVPPEENTAIFFPASYTHTHRGNVVHGEKAKYVITGWFYIS
jgi:hypothetical protein